MATIFPIILLATVIGLAPTPTKPIRYISPVMHVHPGVPTAPRVALTLDACTGRVDNRILSALIDNSIKATVFVTARWLKRNPQALAEMLSHPDLFQIENHGARHLAAVDHPGTVFTVKAAGSADAVRQEIRDGAAAVQSATGREPRWYRGATAEYTASALSEIAAMNIAVAGYSLSGDGGAAYSEKRATVAVASAQNGDVIIAHVNQPLRPAGAGVVAGLLALKAKGYVFVRLDEKNIGH